MNKQQLIDHINNYHTITWGNQIYKRNYTGNLPIHMYEAVHYNIHLNSECNHTHVENDIEDVAHEDRVI